MCRPCAALEAIVAAHRGAGLSVILDQMIASGLPREQIETFLAAEPTGNGTIRDQIIADMTNQLMAALGQSSAQTAAQVKRLRERGAWSGYHQRPAG